MIGTTAISCGVRRKLYDVVVWQVDKPEHPREPKCLKSARHPVNRWKDEDSCPRRCGEPLGVDPDGVVALWD